MDFNECETAKTSDVEGTRFVTMPQIGMSGVSQVRVGVIGCAMRLIVNKVKQLVSAHVWNNN